MLSKWTDNLVSIKNEEKTNAIAFVQKTLFHSKNSWFQLLRILPWLFICQFILEAGCNLVNFSRMAFPPVLFMSRRLWCSLRMRSTWLKPCSATYSTSWVTPVVIIANVFPNVWKMLTALEPNVWTLVKYSRVSSSLWKSIKSSWMWNRIRLW